MDSQTVSIIVLILASIVFTLASIRFIDYARDKWFKKPDPPYKFLDDIIGRKIEFPAGNLGIHQGTILSIKHAKGKGKGGSKNYDLIVNVGSQELRCNIYSKWKFIK